MKYVKLSSMEKKVAITALTKLVESDKTCRIKSMKEWKEIITDYVRTNRLFEYMEKDGDEVEDRFTTSCANQLFHSLLHTGVFVMNTTRSTKTKAKFWRKFDNTLFLKIQEKKEKLLNYIDDATPVSPPPLIIKDGDYHDAPTMLTPPKFIADDVSNKLEIKAYIDELFSISPEIFKAKNYNNAKPKDSL